MSTIWKLRILNTRYKDAEVSFTSRQVIGSSETSADVVLDLPTIAEELVNIETSEEGLILTAIADGISIHVDGDSLDEGTVAPLLVPIHIGELVIMLAQHEDKWPVKIPNFDRPQNNETPRPSRVETPEKQEPNHPSLKVFALILAVTVAVPAALYFYWIPAQTQKDEQVFDLEKTKAALGAEQYRHLNITWNPLNRHIKLIGYVDSNQDKANILKKAESLKLRFSSEIRSMEEIKAATVFILKNLELEAKTIKYGEEAGSLIFVTDASNLRAWSRAENILQRDIPGLRKWELEVIEEQPALEQLKALLNKSSFKNKLSVEDKGDRIELIGTLSGPEMREFNTMKKAFSKHFGANPYLVLVAPKIIKDEAPNLKLSIRSVSLGQVPYLVLNDGKKYFKGARLPNGSRISSIESEAVYLQTDKDTYVVYFDRLL